MFIKSHGVLMPCCPLPIPHSLLPAVLLFRGRSQSKSRCLTAQSCAYSNSLINSGPRIRGSSPTFGYPSPEFQVPPPPEFEVPPWRALEEFADSKTSSKRFLHQNCNLKSKDPEFGVPLPNWRYHPPEFEVPPPNFICMISKLIPGRPIFGNPTK